MKIGICGPGRHGKDLASEYLASISTLRYHSGTSLFAANIVFGEWGWMYYSTKEECFADRAKWRDVWKSIILKHNQDNGVTALYRDCLKDQDILSGLRDRDEFFACRADGFVDLWVWIDASKRIDDPDPTITYTADDCDIVVPNNRSTAEFKKRLFALASTWRVLKPEYTSFP
jgi:hypothetical protein